MIFLTLPLYGSELAGEDEFKYKRSPITPL